MIDTDKYEGHTPAPWQPWKNKRTIEVVRSQLAEKPVVCKVLNECDARLIADAPLLLAEVRRLREENETLRKMDWEYECLWTWLDENTNLLNTIEPLVEEWKKEMIE